MKNLLINRALAAKKKKLFSLFLALVASVGTMFASEQVDGIWYDFDQSSKTATVTYRGSYYHSYSNEYTGDIVIPASVTYGTTYSVTSIGNSAFRGCTGLTSVTIPNSVTSIGVQAFDGCTSLPVTDNIRYAGTYLVNVVDKTQSSYTIQEGTKWIGPNAFQDCNTMTSVTIPNSVTSIGSRAFEDCTGLTTMTIPSVTSIGGRAFYGCTGLISVTIGNSVTSIGGNAFYNCSGLTGEFVIPNSVTSIGSGAFYGCSGLTSVTIGNSVTSIGEDAFYKCSGLTSVTIGNSVKSIGSEAFYGCSSLTSVTIPNSVTSIGVQAFWKCTGLTSVTINSQYIVGKTYSYSSNIKNIFGSQVTQYIIGNSVTSIGDQAFYGCTGLTSVTIGNSVTSIGDYAFNQCSGLTSVTIGNSVTSIGNSAFNQCSSLTSVTIPDSVTSIGNSAFNQCAGLTSVTIGNSVTSIGSNAFYNCSSLTSVTINSPDIIGKTYTSSSNIKNIFGSQVTQYIIGNSVTSIGDYAFYECSSLSSVTIGNSVTSIGSHVFAGCSGLTSVIWNAKNYSDSAPDNTPFYGDYYVDEWCQYIQFDLRPQITSFTFGNEVEHIPAYLCNGMSNLTSITIPNSVTSIGSDAFCGCTGLTSVTIPNSVTSIGNYAFSGCTGLTSVTIGNSVTSIGRSAFQSCTGLITMTIPNSITSIGESAFRYCNRLTSVTIGNSVTSIGNEAFYDCSGLTSIDIPNSVTSIGSDAFYNCSSLTSVTINSPDIIGKKYTSSSNIKNIFGSQVTQYIIGNSVTSIGDYAFFRCSGLTSVTIPNSVTNIGNHAFYDCAGLTSVTIGNSVTSIGDLAFFYCTRLTSVTIPNSVDSIGIDAFHGCTGLTSVTIEAETPPTCGSGALSSTNACPIYVPCNAVNAYKAAWSNYANRIRGNCASYTITFKNWDGSILQSTQVEKGEIPQYTGATPTKPSDSQYSYTFSGWTPQIVAATADATYTATFTATKLPTEECGVNATWLQTGGSGLGEITTDNSGVWTYDNRYGAIAQANSGETGWLLTPAKDLKGMKSVNLSFLHVHKNAGTFTDDMTLWVCANYKGSVSASQWQQLTISPYSANNDWVYVNVSIDVPLNMVGANTVFGFKYTSSNYSAKWEIKELNLNAECAKADETTTTAVTATPNEDNSVTLTWPAVNGADTYTIEIKKNGVLVCTLVFNANGQLISINFAAPARDGKGRNVPAEEQSANGWTYVVTGLEGNASYTYSVTAKDINGNVLLKQSVDFSMGEELTSIEDVQGNNVQCTKVVRNGQLYILRDGKVYNATGAEVK